MKGRYHNLFQFFVLVSWRLSVPGPHPRNDFAAHRSILLELNNAGRDHCAEAATDRGSVTLEVAEINADSREYCWFRLQRRPGESGGACADGVDQCGIGVPPALNGRRRSCGANSQPGVAWMTCCASVRRRVSASTIPTRAGSQPTPRQPGTGGRV